MMLLPMGFPGERDLTEDDSMTTVHRVLFFVYLISVLILSSTCAPLNPPRSFPHSRRELSVVVKGKENKNCGP